MFHIYGPMYVHSLAAQQNDLITLGSSYNGISQIIPFPLYLLDEDTPFTILTLLAIHSCISCVCRRWFLREDKSSSQGHGRTTTT